MTLIFIFLELNRGLKVHDFMFMDDFVMFRCTIECRDHLGNMVHHLGPSTKRWIMNRVN